MLRTTPTQNIHSTFTAKDYGHFGMYADLYPIFIHGFLGGRVREGLKLKIYFPPVSLVSLSLKVEWIRLSCQTRSKTLSHLAIQII